MEEKNKRLFINGDVVYPFTKQENVIGLQKTITDKLPIVSSSAPVQGNYVEKQVWLDIGGEQVPVVILNQNNNEGLSFGNSGSIANLNFGSNSSQSVQQQSLTENGLTFGNANSNADLSFGNANEDLLFDNNDNNDNIINEEEN